jgi:hypothetical protein
VVSQSGIVLGAVCCCCCVWEWNERGEEADGKTEGRGGADRVQTLPRHSPPATRQTGTGTGRPRPRPGRCPEARRPPRWPAHPASRPPPGHVRTRRRPGPAPRGPAAPSANAGAPRADLIAETPGSSMCCAGAMTTALPLSGASCHHADVTATRRNQPELCVWMAGSGWGSS